MNSLDSIYERIRAISWFRHVGQAGAFQLPCDYRTVVSWAAAKRHYPSLQWENTTLEARKALTAFLSVHHSDRFQLWNDITILARDGFVRPLIAEHVMPYQRAQDLEDAFSHSVSWDLLGAIIEFSYRDIPERPTFFLDLLTVYEAGHFPCGWSGIWPTGALLIY